MLAGAVGALAMPPLDLFPALIIPMTVSVWLIDGAQGGKRRSKAASLISSGLEAARDGWWLGFGFFVASLWWLGAAFLVEADQFAWALPLGVLGLPAGLAFFISLGFFISRLLWSSGAARVLALAVGLGLSEWLRAVVLTGFPWNSLGMALGGNLVLGQSASLVGLHGLTILAIALAAAPATLSDIKKGGKVRAPALGALLALMGLSAFGFVRLGQGEAVLEPGIKLRLLQPNLQQDAKFRAEAMPEILSHYLSLSDRATSPASSGINDVTHLVWPESPFPVVLSDSVEALRRISSFLPPGAVLVTGAVRRETSGGGRAASNRYFNSMQVIESGGSITASYDKVHLVPFGEYLPFGHFVESLGIKQFVHVPGGFEPGPKRTALRVPGLPLVSPLICYEAIFPGEVTPDLPSAEGAGLLLNITNDGWFGLTPGPYQHFAQARLRSVEEGLPLVRAANTGISAIIDPYGRVIGSLPLGQEGVLDGPLPKRIDPPLFARFPLLAPFALWTVALAGALALRRRRYG
ncbi:MAG: acyltransferase [Hyphomicrobiales bacterium]|nr:acyltransferase [Hyphomicrobiales bacterium]